MATKYENYITGDDGFVAVWTSGWYAQTFTPSINHIITSVKVKVHRVGASPGTFTAHIRATTSDLPSGTDLGSGTTNGDDVTDNTDGEWIEITLSVGVFASTDKYALILSGPAGASAGNYLGWHDDGSSPTYTGGALCTSGDSGGSWAENTDQDQLFEEWGDPQGSGAGGAIYPTNALQRASGIRRTFWAGLGGQSVYQVELALGGMTTTYVSPIGSRDIPSAVTQGAVTDPLRAYINRPPPITETGLPGVTMPFTTRTPTAPQMYEKESQYDVDMRLLAKNAPYLLTAAELEKYGGK